MLAANSLSDGQDSELSALAEESLSTAASLRMLIENGNIAATPDANLPTPSDFQGNALTPLVTNRFSQAIPSNDWWSSVHFAAYGDQFSAPLFAHPITVQTTGTGLSIAAQSTQVAFETGVTTREFVTPYTPDLHVDLFGSQQPTNFALDSYSDWAFSGKWTGLSDSPSTTVAQGSPFIWLKNVSFNDLKIRWESTAAEINIDQNVAYFSMGNRFYGLYAPEGASWSVENNQARIANTDTGSFTVALLPSQDTATRNAFRQSAANAIIDTQFSYAEADDPYALRLTYDYTLEDADNASDTIIALYPHLSRNATNANLLSTSSYATSRGNMVPVQANHVEAEIKARGVLPRLPAALSGEQINTLRQLLLDDPVASNPGQYFDQFSDPYWSGKAMLKLMQLAQIAEVVGENELQNQIVSAVQVGFADWFHYNGNTADRHFAYNAEWDTLQAYPESFYSGQMLNDHHFHMGYFVHAAALVAIADPTWIADNQAMVDLIIKDVAQLDPNSSDLPRLRNFSPMAGHSWASGHGAFSRGNNHESSSEAMNFATGLMLWGEATQRPHTTRFGQTLYSLEAEAIAEYWFDKYGTTYPDDFDVESVGMVWGDGAAHATWFSAEVEMIKGINFLPFHGGSLYLSEMARDPQALLQEITEMNGGEPDVWQSLIGQYEALVDPENAWKTFSTESSRYEEGQSVPYTYFWMAALANLGSPSSIIRGDHPISAVFTRGDTVTYSAHNAGSDSILVTFSDGTTLNVEPRSAQTITRSVIDPPFDPPEDPNSPLADPVIIPDENSVPTDVAGPNLSIRWPTPEVVMRADTPVNMYGYATDPNDVSSIQISLRHIESGTYWQPGDRFGNLQYHDATIVDAEGHWRLSVTPVLAGNYEMTAAAKNSLGGESIQQTTFAVIGDSQNPITHPPTNEDPSVADPTLNFEIIEDLGSVTLMVDSQTGIAYVRRESADPIAVQRWGDYWDGEVSLVRGDWQLVAATQDASGRLRVLDVNPEYSTRYGWILNEEGQFVGEEQYNDANLQDAEILFEIDLDGNGLVGNIPQSPDDNPTEEPSDTTAPLLISSLPMSGERDVATDANIVLVFDEPVVAGTGMIHLMTGPTDDPATSVTETHASVEMFPATDSRVIIDGNKVTIYLSNNLVPDTTYHLDIGSTGDAFVDMAGQGYVRSHADYQFTTAQPADPVADNPINEYESNPPTEEVTYGFGLLKDNQPNAYETTGFNQGEFVTNINFSHRATADPLVAPGNPDFWHAHDFFVNPSTDAFSTVESLMAVEGSDAAPTSNESVYWVPSMINETNGEYVTPLDSSIAYYSIRKPFDPNKLEVMPTGLSVIAGSAMPNERQSLGIVAWNYIGTTERYDHLPIGDEWQDLPLQAMIYFPQFWDGTNLDSPNHKSHMAYGEFYGGPSTHPHMLPGLELQIHYGRVPQDAQLILTSDFMTKDHPDYAPGWSLHADMIHLPWPEYDSNGELYDGFERRVADSLRFPIFAGTNGNAVRTIPTGVEQPFTPAPLLTEPVFPGDDIVTPVPPTPPVEDPVDPPADPPVSDPQPTDFDGPELSLLWPTPEVVIGADLTVAMYGYVTDPSDVASIQIAMKHVETGTYWQPGNSFGELQYHQAQVVDAEGHWRILVSPILAGNYEMTAVAEDSLGNQSTQQTTFAVIGESQQTVVVTPIQPEDPVNEETPVTDPAANLEVIESNGNIHLLIDPQSGTAYVRDEVDNLIPVQRWGEYWDGDVALVRGDWQLVAATRDDAGQLRVLDVNPNYGTRYAWILNEEGHFTGEDNFTDANIRTAETLFEIDLDSDNVIGTPAVSPDDEIVTPVPPTPPVEDPVDPPADPPVSDPDSNLPPSPALPPDSGIGPPALADLEDGQTLMLVGQTFQDEYTDFIAGTGLTPSGSSHYATFYLGQIEQGDDSPNSQFLDYVRDNDLGDYAMVALSFKDNTPAGGYGQMINLEAADYNSNALWDALNDIRAGEWDAQIDSFAQIMASRSDTQFLLRVGYEVSLLLFAYNGDQYVVDWINEQASAGINVFENPDAIPELDPSAFIDAYNHIVNRIESQASNVDFGFHPVRGYNDTQWLYPGAENVDWVGFSVFNNDVGMEVNGTINAPNERIDPNLASSMNFAQVQGHEIVIAESTAQNPAASDSDLFIEYLDRLDDVVDQYDVAALTYINSNWPTHGWGPEWGDARVEVNPIVETFFLDTFGTGTRYLYAEMATAPSDPPVDPIDDDTGLDLVSATTDTSLLVDSETGLAYVQDAGGEPILIRRADTYWSGDVPLSRGGSTLLAAARDELGRLRVLDVGDWGPYAWILDESGMFIGEEGPTESSVAAKERLFQINLDGDGVISQPEGITPPAAPPANPDPSGDLVADGVKVRLMSFNVYYAALGAPWRIDGIAQAIADYSPDIASIQEMWGEREQILAAIEAKTGLDYEFSTGSNTWDGDILYRADRWKILDDGVITYDGSRGMTYATLEHLQTGEKLSVYGMHPLAGVSEDYHLRNMEMVTQHMAASAYADEAPVVLIGDLNAAESLESMRLIRDGSINAFGQEWNTPITFEDTFRVANGDTANGDTGFGVKIDYIYTEERTNPVFRTVNASIRRDAPGGSDHFPVMAEIILLSDEGNAD